MKVKTRSGIVEQLDFERIANELQELAEERHYYFNKSDLDCLIKDIKKELISASGNSEIISYYELRYIIRKILESSKFKWLCESTIFM